MLPLASSFIATCSGKTTTAKRLCKESPHIIAIHQDHFYREEHLVPKSKEGYVLWDDVAALDWSRLDDHIETVCLHPELYCTTCKQVISLPPSECPHLVLIEGTQILHTRKLLELYDLSFFITLDYSTCSSRRRARYRDPVGFFDHHVWPEYCRTEKAVRTMSTVTLLDGRDRLDALYHRIAATPLVADFKSALADEQFQI